jgi:DNA polymerase III alpha subunit
MYIPLNVKTNYHLLSSLIDIKHLIEETHSLGISSIAITDSSMHAQWIFIKNVIVII